MQNDSQINMERQTFAVSELMPVKADYLWLLQQGVVKTRAWTEEGTPIVLGYWGVEDIIGQPLSLVYPYQAKCLTRVEAVSIPIAQAHQIIDLINRHAQQTEELLHILRSETMYQRLSKMLIWLGQKFGTEISFGRTIDLSITHQDLAEVIGATRVTVTKLINQLEKEGFLSRPERNTIVLLKQWTFNNGQLTMDN